MVGSLVEKIEADVADDKVGYYIFPFALGNFLGSLLLSRLFECAPRR